MQAGISGRSVDKLFVHVDLNGDGVITEDEFVQVIQEVLVFLGKDKTFEERLKRPVPDNHVIPGSSRMNGLSGTTAFRMQVVRYDQHSVTSVLALKPCMPQAAQRAGLGQASTSPVHHFSSTYVE